MKTHQKLHTSTLQCAFAGGSRWAVIKADGSTLTHVNRPQLSGADMLYSIGTDGTLTHVKGESGAAGEAAHTYRIAGAPLDTGFNRYLARYIRRENNEGTSEAIAIAENEEAATFIIRACNSHAALVGALESLTRKASEIAEFPHACESDSQMAYRLRQLDAGLAAARSALQSAKGAQS